MAPSRKNAKKPAARQPKPSKKQLKEQAPGQTAPMSNTAQGEKSELSHGGPQGVPLGGPLESNIARCKATALILAWQRPQ